MNAYKELTGLYAITDPRLAAATGLIHQVALALAEKVRVIQYRDKGSDWTRRFEQATALQRLCRQSGSLLIVNDDVELAAAVQSDGVHLGKSDMTLQRARQRLGHNAIIGISCYNQFERALEAQREGADYVAFGRFFPSKTKPQAVLADIGLLRRARLELAVPTVAIGGITPENGGALVAAGADMLAVIHGVFGQRDITAACHRYNQLFHRTEAESS